MRGQREREERDADFEQVLVIALAYVAGSARSWLRHSLPRTEDNEQNGSR